jgi:hypothetical protein
LRTKYNILDRQQIASQWRLKLIFRMHNIYLTPQGVENRNILLWFKCVLTALHVNCMIQFDKVLELEQEKNVLLSAVIKDRERNVQV